MRKLIVILVLVSQVVFGQKPSKANAIILAYAEQNLGKKVGNGVCRTLTNEAVYEYRNAKNKNTKKVDFGGTTPGLKIKDIKNANGGDFIGFENIIVDKGYFLRDMESHIGIVKSVDEEKVVYYNQNVLKENQTTKKHSKVQIDTIFFKNVVCGEMSIYRIY